MEIANQRPVGSNKRSSWDLTSQFLAEVGEMWKSAPFWLKKLEWLYLLDLGERGPENSNLKVMSAGKGTSWEEAQGIAAATN